MTAAKLPPQDYLRECFDYDPLTGQVLWRRRPEHHFTSPGDAARWNTKHAGQLAFGFREADGYRSCKLTYGGAGKTVRLHRVVWKMMTGDEPEVIDHKDRDPANNRFANLREANFSQNNTNRVRPRANGLPKGVYSKRGRFSAAGFVGKRRYHLGTFSTPSEAHAAYCAWGREIYGEFFQPGPGQQSVFD